MIKKYHLTLARVAIIKKLQTINAGEGVEKRAKDLVQWPPPPGTEPLATPNPLPPSGYVLS